MLCWSPALKVGHPIIDAQHEELFRRLEKLVQAMANGDRTEIGRLFEFLRRYVADHFQEEERFMRRTAFPGLVGHEQQHAKFVCEYETLVKAFSDFGPSAFVTVRATHWISAWLVNHIGKSDARLAEHLRSVAA